VDPDWVYEEELLLRDGFRWSPNGRSIAYWQIDDEGVRDFYLVNNVDGLYATLQSIPYPKAGEMNPAGRALPTPPAELRIARVQRGSDIVRLG
jgi:dipeptidyl-peptidase-4